MQARSHARAMVRVRPIREVRVAGRDPAKAHALAEELGAELEATVGAAGSFKEALHGADVACATTYALQPVVRREWVSPGTHITSVSNNPDGRELDDQIVADALVCVESRRAALAPVPAGSPDLIDPIERGVIGVEHIHAELGELIAGIKPGRATEEQITLYKSVGVAAQDAAATALVLGAARQQNTGLHVSI